jgi:ElaB/YqjD/DUF883 family membrane-anchored ribosome-binding protein
MNSKNAQSTPAAGAGAAAALKADMERTRQSLSDAVEAIAAKTDVKARAHEAGQSIGKATEDLYDPAKNAAMTAATFLRKYPTQTVAAIAGLLAGLLARRRRSR